MSKATSEFVQLSVNPGEPSVIVETERIEQQQESFTVDRGLPAGAPWMPFILSLVAILPFWTVRYPVMIDYPNHLARWFVLFHMRDAAYHFGSLYAPAWGPLPYITPDILAMALQYFLPIAIAGKCILSLGILLVALATYFLLKQVCPENIPLASFGVLIAMNPMYLMGSISYGYSIAFCLLVVGLWVSYCKTPKVITAVGIVGGLILVYFTHLMGFLVAGLVMGVFALFQEQRWKKVGILAALSIPALLIFVLNPVHPGEGPMFVYGGVTILDKLKSLAFPVRLFTFKRDFVFLAGLAILVLLALKKRAMLALQPVWLAVCSILLVVYFAAPIQYGAVGGYFDVRFLPFLYLFLLLVFRFGRVPRYLYIGLAVLVLFRVATVEQMYISHQRELKQLNASFEAVPRNARVLPLVFLPQTGSMERGDIHYLEYGVIERGFLDPMLFHIQGVQPIRLVGSPYCPNVFCDSANNAPDVDWQQVANSYDYLWVHRDPGVIPSASQIGDVIFSDDSVTVYRIRHSQL
jgi:hypothetical protein